MATATKRLDGALFRRYDYGDRQVVAVDLGPGTDEVSVDLLDGLALLVVERDGESVQRELELPDGEAQAVMNNGILTIEVRG